MAMQYKRSNSMCTHADLTWLENVDSLFDSHKYDRSTVCMDKAAGARNAGGKAYYFSVQMTYQWISSQLWWGFVIDLLWKQKWPQILVCKQYDKRSPSFLFQWLEKR